MSITAQREGAPPAGAAAVAKILLDTPAVTPQLGFDVIATALAQVIAGSEPRFAVGIFGGWGSGKTTLMRAIRAKLSSGNVVVVDFNAWRFEREPQLLVPMLDTIRAALVDWSSATEPQTREKVRSVAGRVGRVVRALAAGLSGEVGLPGAAKVSYDVGKAMDALALPADPEQPQSLYVAAFHELSDALGELTAGGIDRVVVFVDDLDRCLPDSALDVLESIKLFFDLPGFVFVVGLDEEAVDRAVQAKFTGLVSSAAAPAYPQGEGKRGDAPLPAPQIGREYVKKIFQVPYTLPPVVLEDIDQLLWGMYAESQLPQPQIDDFEKRVRPYLRYITVERRVNPREVKRFLNAYTLQTLVRPWLDRDTVLALQTLTFRYEWDEALSDVILADPPLFLELLRAYRDGGDDAFADIWPHLATLPDELADYLRSEQAAALVRQPDLGPYVSSLQSTAHVPSWLTDAYSMLGDLSRLARSVRDNPSPEGASDLASRIERGVGTLDRTLRSFFPPTQLGQLAKVLDDGRNVSTELGQADSDDAVRGLAARILRQVADTYRELRRLRDVSPLSAA